MTEEVELEGLRKKPKVYTPEGNEVLDVMRPPWAKDARIALQSMSNTNGGAETATTSASKENEDEDTLRNLSDEKKKGFESEESRLKERRDKLVKLVGHIQAAKNELEVIVDAVSQLGKGLTIGGVAAAQATKRMSGRNGNNGNVLALERKKKQLESCSHIFKEAHGMLQRTLEVSKSESSGLRKLRRKWKVSQSPSSSSGFHVDLSIPAIDVKVEPVGIEKEHTSGPAAEAFDEGLRKRMESIVDSAFETAMTREVGRSPSLRKRGEGEKHPGAPVGLRQRKPFRFISKRNSWICSAQIGMDSQKQCRAPLPYCDTRSRSPEFPNASARLSQEIRDSRSTTRTCPHPPLALSRYRIGFRKSTSALSWMRTR